MRATTVLILLAAGCARSTPIVLIDLKANPSQLGFSSVPLDSSTTLRTTITNEGGQTEVLRVRATRPFTASPVELTLTPGTEQVISITFSPTQAGFVTGQVSVTSTDATVNIELVGIGADETCPAFPEPCTIKTCDPLLGCRTEAKPDGTPCGGPYRCAIASCVSGECRVSNDPDSSCYHTEQAGEFVCRTIDPLPAGTGRLKWSFDDPSYDIDSVAAGMNGEIVADGVQTDLLPTVRTSLFLFSPDGHLQQRVDEPADAAGLPRITPGGRLVEPTSYGAVVMDGESGATLWSWSGATSDTTSRNCLTSVSISASERLLLATNCWPENGDHFHRETTLTFLDERGKVLHAEVIRADSRLPISDGNGRFFLMTSEEPYDQSNGTVWAWDDTGVPLWNRPFEYAWGPMTSALQLPAAAHDVVVLPTAKFIDASDGVLRADLSLTLANQPYDPEVALISGGRIGWTGKDRTQPPGSDPPLHRMIGALDGSTYQRLWASAETAPSDDIVREYFATATGDWVEIREVGWPERIRIEAYSCGGELRLQCERATPGATLFPLLTPDGIVFWNHRLSVFDWPGLPPARHGWLSNGGSYTFGLSALK